SSDLYSTGLPALWMQAVAVVHRASGALDRDAPAGSNAVDRVQFQLRVGARSWVDAGQRLGDLERAGVGDQHIAKLLQSPPELSVFRSRCKLRQPPAQQPVHDWCKFAHLVAERGGARPLAAEHLVGPLSV